LIRSRFTLPSWLYNSRLADQLSEHWQRLLLAVSFMTRLPVPQQLDYSSQRMHQALVYFPLVGWLLALLLVAVFCAVNVLFGSSVAVVLTMIASLLMTGALHEDGLADCFDGFYGGFERQSKLEIMKDSRIGTYGSCALILALALKLVALISLAEAGTGMVVLAILVAYPFSRALAITHAQDLSYVSAPGKSKSDPLARPLSRRQLLTMVSLGAISLILLPWQAAALVFAAGIGLRWLLKRWMDKHIAGFTGDALGAAQQLQELVVYLMLLATLQQGWLA